MRAFTVAEAVVGAKGTIVSGSDKSIIRYVVRDSREAVEGSLFIALIGDRNDGHDYIFEAYNNGCRIFLISKAKIALKIPPDATLILVEDTIKGLQELSKYYLRKFRLIRIGVTGSTGKTTTKEMLYTVFSQRFRTIKNTGNYNNHIGVPLTIFKIEEETEAGIFEMGMNNPGEIDALADIVCPQAAVITNIGISHIGNLGSRENILKAKLEITNYMGSEDLLIYNSDNDMMKYIRPLEWRTVSVGTDEKANVRIKDVQSLREGGISFVLSYEGETQKFAIPVPGIHNAFNAALAAACGLHFGISLAEASKGLTTFATEDKRLNIKDANGLKIIDDTYNASPDSMKAAIDVLKNTEGKRRIAVLADMFELGADEVSYHMDVGRYAAESGIEIIISVGENARYISEGAKETVAQDRVIHFKDKDLLDNSLNSILKKGDVILLKGSRGMKMDETVRKIMEMGI